MPIHVRRATSLPVWARQLMRRNRARSPSARPHENGQNPAVPGPRQRPSTGSPRILQPPRSKFAPAECGCWKWGSTPLQPSASANSCADALTQPWRRFRDFIRSDGFIVCCIDLRRNRSNRKVSTATSLLFPVRMQSSVLIREEDDRRPAIKVFKRHIAKTSTSGCPASCRALSPS